jgi:hypothetical protein
MRRGFTALESLVIQRTTIAIPLRMATTRPRYGFIPVLYSISLIYLQRLMIAKTKTTYGKVQASRSAGTMLISYILVWSRCTSACYPC